MTNNESAREYGPIALIGLVIALCGWFAAPYMHGLANLPTAMVGEYIANCFGFGGGGLPEAQRNDMLCLTFALQGALFGLYVLIVSSIGKGFQLTRALVATLSCSAWLLWIQTQAPYQYPNMDLSKFFLGNQFMISALANTGIAAMSAVVLVWAVARLAEAHAMNRLNDSADAPKRGNAETAGQFG
jgi:hypothetical protein